MTDDTTADDPDAQAAATDDPDAQAAATDDGGQDEAADRDHANDAADEWDEPTSASSGGLPGGGDSLVLTGAYWVVLVAAGFTALFAFVGFYTQAQRAIRLWVAAKYEPIVLAAFSLSVFLVALIGASLSVRNLAGGRGE